MKSNIFKLIFEQDTTIADPPEENVKIQGDKKPKARLDTDSVDNQIDSLILLYEKRSIKDEDEEITINESFFSRNLKTFLFEQDEPEKAEEPAETTPPPTGMTNSDNPSTGGDPGEVKPADEELVPDLDIDKFTKEVARLVMNRQRLLSIKDVIVNRAKNFLDEKYGDAFVSEFLKALEDQFGIVLSEFEEEEDVLDAPYGIGANPAGAGISGGGS